MARAVDYIRQTARGLGFAHENGVVHRDIKPANLLLDKSGTIKILDMGLARFDDGLAAQEGLTQSGQVMGTVDYMAPEQAFDTRSADARADIYSLGCTLYRLLTGQNMYDGESLVQKLMAHQSKPIPSLVGQASRLPSSPPRPLGEGRGECDQSELAALTALDPIFQKMVAKLPEDRYQSMSDVEAALAPFANSPSGSQANHSSGGSGRGNPSYEVEPTSAFPAPVAVQLVSSPSAAVDGYSPTVSLAGPEQSTDPVSERSIQFARQNTPRPAGGTQRPPWWRRQPAALIAAGLGGILLVVLGIWVIVRDQQGKEVARIQVPEGGNVTVQAGDGTSAPVKSGPFNPEVPSVAVRTNYAMVLDGSGFAEVENFVHERQQPITIEAWAKLKPTRVVRPFITLPGPDYRIKIQQGAMAGSNLLQFGASLGNSSPPDFMCVNSRRPPADWFHVALCVYGADKFAAFVDGKPIKELPRFLNNALMQRSNVLMIGNDRDPNAKSIDGLIDELRVSESIRYVEPFTPKRRFEPDADTVALYHFDEGQGDVLVDSSGHNHHGKIVGATWVHVADIDAGARAMAATQSVQNSSLVFDGVDDYAELPIRLKDVGLYLPDKPFTYEAFVTAHQQRAEARTAKTRSSIMTPGIMGFFQIGALTYVPNNPLVDLVYSTRLYSDKPFPELEEHHVAMVWDGQEVRMYVDGIKQVKGVARVPATDMPPNSEFDWVPFSLCGMWSA